MRALVRQHLACVVRRHRDGGGESLARPRDAVGADVILRDPPGRLGLLCQNALRAPAGQSACRTLRRVGQGQVNDVVGAARQVVEPGLVRDDVIGRRDQGRKRAGDGGVVPERPERPHGGHAWSLMVRTLEAAAAWVDEVGLALLFPKADVVLPSLWEQVNGSAAPDWAVRDTEGNFVHWSEPLSFLWGAKDDLPAEGLVCVGKHVARVATCVAPRLLPLLVGAAEPAEPGVDEEAIAAAIESEGPLTGPQLRDLTG